MTDNHSDDETNKTATRKGMIANDINNSFC